MKFESAESFMRYLFENKLDISKLDVTLMSSISNNDLVSSVSDISVLIESFSDSPKVKAETTDSDDNILYVDDVDVMENCCSTGKIKFMNRMLFLNICESEGIVKIKLNLNVNGNKYTNVPFTVKKIDDIIKETKVILSKNLIKDE